jgi:transcriptional regulator with XRE-family HTH domain
MGVARRAIERGTRRAEQFLRAIADEFREARLTAGLSQAVVARGAGLSRSVYGRIERGERRSLAIVEASRAAAVLGLDLSMRLYPNGDPLRDKAQQQVVAHLMAVAARPLRCRTEVPLPRVDGRPELRGWDLEFSTPGKRTVVEVETRLHDAQAQERRVALKRRDDPADGFLLVIADTRTNRRVLAQHPELWPDLPRLRRRDVLGALAAGRHPPTGLVLV